ncbi:MAG TPA: transcriptional regulator NrdR, partial [Polyangiaceae bacterium]|nr:transcriptional regulator NrdR [Polyangiaceae bacterium]
RRRECEACGRRFTTYERVEEALPTVVKKDGGREPYDRQKLLRGLRIACNKRPVSTDQLEAMADAIEREVQEAGTGRREVTSSELGERGMAHLRTVDEVAYVRFASVYRSFRDIDEFLTELGKLVKAKGP